MAYKAFDGNDNDYNSQSSSTDSGQRITLNGNNGEQQVDLPDNSYVRDADIIRDGNDLVLETTDGTVVIEGYYLAEPTPNLVAPDGITLTPDLVNSFSQSGNQYADSNLNMSDVSPIGAVQEISGKVTVTRMDGTVETISIGTPIYQGDIIDTEESSAVNIMFVDETTFAISEDARLAIDEYVFDPASNSGTSNFSVLKGVFVFTSGLIGRDDPDDVMIDTPSGSIGIRGTIIAGNVDTGEITVIEGAIVLHDFSGNSITLTNQYESARFNTMDSTIDHMGDLSAGDVSAKFISVSPVSADLFSSIEDSATETGQDNEAKDGADQEATPSEAEAEAEIQTEEIITSDEILNTPTESTAEPAPLDSPTIEPTTNDDIEPIKAEAPPPPPPESERPPFHVEVLKFSFAENGSGGDNVMHIKGHFTSHTDIHLVGPSNNYYEVIREGENDFLIKLKAGIAIDAERPYKLLLQASNENGAISQVHNIDLNIINVNETTVLTNAMPTMSGSDNYFSGSNGSHFRYDFSNEFFDADGDIASYSIGYTGDTSNMLATDFTNGIFNFDLSGISGNTLDKFQFTVSALDGSMSTLSSKTYYFDVYDDFFTTIGGAVMITTSGKTYSGTDTDITIAAGNVSVFTDHDLANNLINIGASNSFVKSGGGNDTINVGGSYSKVYTEGGNDTFNMNEAKGHFYAGDGNDEFILQNMTTVNGANGLQSLSPSQATLDGGNGFDLLQLGVTGNIDFSLISAGLVKNIEKIAFINGSANTIDLDYQSVIDMTDGDNVLVIDMDATDTLNFDNSGNPNNFYKVGEDRDGIDQYDIYSDGNITLFVDTDHSAVSGII